MNTSSQWLIRIIIVGGLLVLPAMTGHDQVYAYPPVDELVTHVDQLYQAQEITDIRVMANLTVSLEAIGAMVDEGQIATAKDLVGAFLQEVQSGSGALMSKTAADQLVAQATAMAANL